MYVSFVWGSLPPLIWALAFDFAGVLRFAGAVGCDVAIAVRLTPKYSLQRMAQNTQGHGDTTSLIPCILYTKRNKPRPKPLWVVCTFASLHLRPHDNP